LASVAVFVAVNVLFYSSFFTNAKGVGVAVEALKVWSKTGASEFHAKPWHTYLKWLLQEESPLLVLGAAGAALALWSGRNRFAVFAGAWAFGTLAAYSLVPYKTPWLALNFTVPLAVAGGYAVQELAETFRHARPGAHRLFPAAVLVGALCLLAVGLSFAHVTNPSEYLCRAVGVWCDAPSSAADGPGLSGEWGALAALAVAALVVGWCVWRLYAAREGSGGAWRRSAPALALAALAVVVCTYQAWVVSFRQYDNDEYPYVYAHTRRQFLTLVGEIERLVARAGTGPDTRIAATAPGPGSDSYWPLPWYLNDYRSVGYHAQLPAATAAGLSIIVGNATQDAQLRATLGATHRKVGATYPLRPGVDLVLYAQRDLTVR
jgi:predicted membrane-bound mannosyltransferase